MLFEGGFGKYVNCFVDGTDAVMADFDSQALGGDFVASSGDGEGEDSAGIALSTYEIVAGACVLVGVVGAVLSEVNSRKKRKIARYLNSVDAILTNEEWDDLEIHVPASTSFQDDSAADWDYTINAETDSYVDESKMSSQEIRDRAIGDPAAVPKWDRIDQDVDANIWRKLILAMYTPEGDRFDITLLRPIDWIESCNAQVPSDGPITSREFLSAVSLKHSSIHAETASMGCTLFQRRSSNTAITQVGVIEP